MGVVAEHVVHRPPAPLRGLVASCVGYRLDGFPAGVHIGMPSPLLTVVLSLDGPVEVRDAGGGVHREVALASGFNDRPVAIPHEGAQHGVQIDLTPEGARALLGCPPAALARQVAPLADLLGAPAGEAQERMHAAQGWPARLAALDAVLLRALARTPRGVARPDAEAALRGLLGSGGTARVAHLAAGVGLSRRRLGDVVRGEYGLPPKALARIIRFDRSRRMLMHPARPAIGAVAAACGYADQAHMDRDWRGLAGASPSAWLRDEVFPFVQDAAGRDGGSSRP
ncbi:MAG: helix-turn-helix domain-containing protein [Thermoleophilia bacterium]|nr:helix-turn-helix domain-containing protein [Thermoleophilia bacterium]